MPNSDPMTLLIVTINYRTPDLTIGLLESLAPQVGALGGCKVVVVDNASGDDSVARIGTTITARGWSSWVELVPSQTNRGYAGGLNLGIRSAPAARYVLMINNDVIVHEGCLSHCLRVMDTEPTIGVMSCRLVEPDGTVQTTARKAPTPSRSLACAFGLPWKLPALFAWADQQDHAWDRSTVKRDVEWLGGAFMLTRGDLIRTIGGLDESFFFYGEDVEFSHRVRKAGYRCHYDPAVSITHFAAASSDPSRVSAQLRNRYGWDARYLVQRKCYGRLAERMLRTADLLVWSARAAWFRLRHGRQQRYDDARAVLAILMNRSAT